ncbi:SDR family NAD(P)-dependent oxidoreductase [Mucilaginibacter sp. JRF]|uniref:SDR family NAD(P)-dependent oxidoreductase n=1 Tax=Mucilaginibacter sp. JRF TaxID=2780088 RepID=UPI00187DF411|nr:SDR family NAD(P)-dependent oxidoreductase [Mucilaginibacter sp. JRF]MBE9583320.1 SDR family NAD(P)-dependent oxidoreductase [Mucilaginibacter sp. JRF]
MENDKNLTVLITGAGSGMGLHTAQTLALLGYKVFAGVRDPQGRNAHKSTRLLEPVESQGKSMEIVDLDILLEDSCEQAAKTIIDKEGSIDVVIHNAAHLFIGYSEAFKPEQIASSFNTNVLGAHRLNRAVLPYMRKEGNGLILYVGSGITNVTAPFMAPYVLGKAALDALAENTAYEIGQFGVESTILMPGVYMDDTSHFDTAEFPADETVLKAYDRLQKDYDHYEDGLRNLFRFGDAPIQSVAEKIAEILALPAGERPLRTTVDYSDWVAEPGNGVREALTERAFKILGYSHLLKIKK